MSEDAGTKPQEVNKGVEGVNRAIPLSVKEVGGLSLTEFYQLHDGRMEVRWTPTDMEVHEEIDYLTKKAPVLVSHTGRQAQSNEDLVHYIFTGDGKWMGIRCPSLVWKLFLQSQNVSEALVTEFLEEWAASPLKTLTSKGEPVPTAK